MLIRIDTRPCSLSLRDRSMFSYFPAICRVCFINKGDVLKVKILISIFFYFASFDYF